MYSDGSMVQPWGNVRAVIEFPLDASTTDSLPFYPLFCRCCSLGNNRLRWWDVLSIIIMTVISLEGRRMVENEVRELKETLSGGFVSN